jgi:quercetin dioxygenase-like cupin family protein
MKKIEKSIVKLFASIILIGVGIVVLSCTRAPKQNSGNNLVFPQGEKITNKNFRGTAYLKMLIEADSVNPTAVGNVTFEPGARTKWHYHPAGQILLVIDGVGYYQEKGQPKKILRKGDVVKCPPNTRHWHGASVDRGFVQVAVTNNHLGSTVWLEEVKEEEYNAVANQ